MVRLMLLALAAMAAMAGAAFPASAQTSQVRCESRNYQPNACPAYNARDVRIADRLGGNCRPGSDWNFDGRNINVFNGCRAVFTVYFNNYGGGGGYPGGNYPGGGYPGAGYPGGGYPGGGNFGGQMIRCQSENYRQVRCPIDTRGGVQLQRQIGNTPCVQGRTWGWDRNGVWVNNGCRGEFLVAAGGGGGGWNGGNNGIRTIECSSRNYRPERCNVPISNSVSIDRVLGGECIQGRSWGWDRGGVWVNNGCRARFQVY